ncbi:glycosyltransferase [Streptomyces sp. 769]|uniref:glycosyltransferase n=1 Tax=Streptomyces sp. 769 TaxID=1262452 RepID=UPI00131D3FC3|nr:glycosyltransferase [Streptomyces sp. 769]
MIALPRPRQGGFAAACGSRSVLVVSLAWQMNAASGSAKATAALAVGLAGAGHRAVIVTAAPPMLGPRLEGVVVEQIDLPVSLPCLPETLREAIDVGAGGLQRQLWSLIARHNADTVLFTGALWGLGRLRMDLPDGVCRVLAVGRLPDDRDATALRWADIVLAPTAAVLNAAHQRGWDTSTWRVVPHALLHEPPEPRPASVLSRLQWGDLRVLSAVGDTSNGVVALLRAARHHRDTVGSYVVRVAAAAHYLQWGPAGVALAETCRRQVELAEHMSWCGELPWHAVPAWLSGAAVVIAPSTPGSLGMVAVEAMSVGVPVIGYRSEHLSCLIGPAQHAQALLAEPHHGPRALLNLARALLGSPRAYCETAQAVYEQSRRFTKARVTQQFLAAVPPRGTLPHDDRTQTHVHAH